MKHIDVLSTALPPVQAKPSMCKSKSSPSPASKNKQLSSCETERRKRTALTTMGVQSWGSLLEADTLYKHDGGAEPHFATCYKLL